MVSTWTSRPTYLILRIVGDEFISLLSWNVERRDPFRLQLVALVTAIAMTNPRRLNSLPALNRPYSSHRV